MAFDLKDFIANTAEVDVVINGHGTIHITYKPGLITPDRINEQGNSEEGTFQFLCDVISEWDLKNGKAVVPLTVEALKGVPSLITNRVVNGILGDDPLGEAASPSSDG